MENVNLHELPRKELKQLCHENNIRTAGVKHDDLVRLLRNKLYPPAPDPPRLLKSRSQKSTDSQTSSKNVGAFTEKTTNQGRTQRSLASVDDPSRGNAPERRRELSPNPALLRKPILTKATSTPARRSDFLRKKVNTLSGLDKQSQDRQPQRSDGSPSETRSSIGGRRPSIRSTPMVGNRPGERLNVKVNVGEKPQIDADAYSKAASSPLTSADSSDIGSTSFRSVSEIASDVGHHVLSEDSDIDDGRSVSSEPASRFTAQTNKLASRMSTGSKLGRTVFSSWDSGYGRDSLESSAKDNEFHKQDSDVSGAPGGEHVFSYCIEDADSLVGDTDDLDSFLDSPTADPEDVRTADGHQVDSEQFHTPVTSTAHFQESDIVDPKGSMMGEVAIIHNNEAPFTDSLPESLPGDRWLVDYEIATASDRAGIVDTNAALSPSEDAVRTEILKNGNGSLPVENAVVDGDSDIAPQRIQSPPCSLEHVSAIAPDAILDLDRSAELVEDISSTSDSTPDILDDEIEHVESAELCQINSTVDQEPENLPGIELPYLGDDLSSSGKEISREASDVVHVSVHAEEKDSDTRGLEVEEDRRVSDKDVAGVHIAENNEGQSKMLEPFREIPDPTEVAIPPLTLVSEEIGDVDDSSIHKRSRVVVTTSFSDSDVVSHCDFEDETSVGDASCATPDNIHAANLTPSEPVEDRGDVKWSFVSALYDDVEDVNNTNDLDGHGVLEHILAEAGESGTSSVRDIESLHHLKVPENEVVNHSGPAVIDIERHEATGERNKSANISLFDANGTHGGDLTLNEIASMNVEHAEVEDVSQNGSTGIALKSDSFQPVMYTTEVEATFPDQEYEETRSDLSIPLDFESSRDSDVHHELSVALSFSQQCIGPFIGSVDNVEGENSSESDDSLQNSADDVSGASFTVEDECESLSQTQQTFESFVEESTSTGASFQTSTEVEEIESKSTGDVQEDLGVSIEAVPLAEGTESPTGLMGHASRMPSSYEHGDVCVQGEQQSLVLKHLHDSEPHMLEKDETGSFSETRQTFEGFGEESISTGVNFQTSAEVEETETRSTRDDQEDLGISIEAVSLAGGTESSTGSMDHESRMPSSHEQDDDCVRGGQQFLVLKHLHGSESDMLGKTCLDNTAATSHPRKLEKFLTVGLKMILVIGSLTLGILKYRASRLRLGDKS